MARAWGGAGAWAAEAELADQEAKEREAATYKAPGAHKEEAFPSLGDSLQSKPTKKKNKGVTVSLSELMVGKYVGPGGKQRSSYTDSTKLTTEELLSLPTGPRERAEDEAPIGGLGGGFKDYGGFRGGANDRAGEREERRGGFGGGYGGDREGGGGGFGRDRSRERDDGPSRADSDDKWGATKKFVPSLPSERGADRGGERGGYEEDRGRGGRLSDRDMPSRADEVDNWGSTKKFVPAAPAGAGGDGYNDRRSSGRYEERRVSMGGFDDHPRSDRDLVSRADEVDNWGKGKKFVPSAAPPSRGAGGGFDSTYREAGADADRWARKEPVARDPEQPRVSERPRLKLAPRSLPVDSPPRPASASTEVNGEKEGGETEQQSSPAQKPKARFNPFGGARPREEILAEKGQDYRKIDAELEVPRERFGRPGSSHSNRPGSSHSTRPGSRPGTPGGVSSRPGTPEVPRSRPSPFGEARPRDTNLVEARGKDSQTLNVDLERRLAEESVNEETDGDAAGSEV
ncbi:hypothetical protein M758_1G330500 [Ceratodon purpureus]|uniref:Eukaryotic translation initiation factor 4B n=1 Tax=Ceratodon purpureus TaxID=3225 RepID=A0A8T0JF80_CERPU|nr:hypothetical protein KC19_1G338000 [Ceratodon purpureus]KAG0632466.1 hypothetical protein M758_1G330500 [Ceratodon purpureus]